MRAWVTLCCALTILEIYLEFGFIQHYLWTHSSEFLKSRFARRLNTDSGRLFSIGRRFLQETDGEDLMALVDDSITAYGDASGAMDKGKYHLNTSDVFEQNFGVRVVLELPENRDTRNLLDTDYPDSELLAIRKLKFYRCRGDGQADSDKLTRLESKVDLIESDLSAVRQRVTESARSLFSRLRGRL